MLSKELRIRCARTAMIGLLGVLMSAGALAAQPGLASGKRSHHARHAKSSSAKRGSGTSETAAADGRLHAAVEAALEGLVREGTIDQHQAEVIDAQVNTGSVDPGELVARGVVSEAQMRAVADALGEVKRSFAPAGTGGESAGVKSPGTKGGSGTNDTAAADTRLHAAVQAALEGLVREGTINQHQAEVIDAQVNAGSVDPGELVARGVLSEAQMQAVANALVAVKRSFAG
jgi:hypothetical protein